MNKKQNLYLDNKKAQTNHTLEEASLEAMVEKDQARIYDRIRNIIQPPVLPLEQSNIPSLKEYDLQSSVPWLRRKPSSFLLGKTYQLLLPEGTRRDGGKGTILKVNEAPGALTKILFMSRTDEELKHTFIQHLQKWGISEEKIPYRVQVIANDRVITVVLDPFTKSMIWKVLDSKRKENMERHLETYTEQVEGNIPDSMVEDVLSSIEEGTFPDKKIHMETQEAQDFAAYILPYLKDREQFRIGSLLNSESKSPHLHESLNYMSDVPEELIDERKYLNFLDALQEKKLLTPEEYVALGKKVQRGSLIEIFTYIFFSREDSALESFMEHFSDTLYSTSLNWEDIISLGSEKYPEGFSEKLPYIMSQLVEHNLVDPKHVFVYMMNVSHIPGKTVLHVMEYFLDKKILSFKDAQLLLNDEQGKMTILPWLQWSNSLFTMEEKITMFAVNIQDAQVPLDDVLWVFQEIAFDASLEECKVFFSIMNAKLGGNIKEILSHFLYEEITVLSSQQQILFLDLLHETQFISSEAYILQIKHFPERYGEIKAHIFQDMWKEHTFYETIPSLVFFLQQDLELCIDFLNEIGWEKILSKEFSSLLVQDEVRIYLQEYVEHHTPSLTHTKLRRICELLFTEEVPATLVKRLIQHVHTIKDFSHLQKYLLELMKHPNLTTVETQVLSYYLENEEYINDVTQSIEISEGHITSKDKEMILPFFFMEEYALHGMDDFIPLHESLKLLWQKGVSKEKEVLLREYFLNKQREEHANVVIERARRRSFAIEHIHLEQMGFLWEHMDFAAKTQVLPKIKKFLQEHEQESPELYELHKNFSSSWSVCQRLHHLSQKGILDLNAYTEVELRGGLLCYFLGYLIQNPKVDMTTLFREKKKESTDPVLKYGLLKVITSNFLPPEPTKEQVENDLQKGVEELPTLVDQWIYLYQNSKKSTHKKTAKELLLQLREKEQKQQEYAQKNLSVKEVYEDMSKAERIQFLETKLKSLR